MSQNQRSDQRANQRPKEKLVPTPEHIVHIKQPMVRNFSTGGGHLPGDTITEGDGELRMTTKKWQGYPPENLNVLGKPMPPVPEVSIPRFTGKAQYATRVVFPSMLHVKMLTSPHPRATIKNIDTSKAEKIPGVAYVLTYKNAPSTYPMTQDLNFQGEIVAFVAADTEDTADDAIEALEVEYNVLSFIATIHQVMSPGQPELLRPGQGKGNLVLLDPSHPESSPTATSTTKHGDVQRGFAEADIVKEFTYYFAGARPIPFQPCGSVAKWDGDKLTFWGTAQGTFPQRDTLARGLGINVENIHFINKWNGGTFGGITSARLNPWIAYIAKMTNRPARLMMPKDQELALNSIKPENITTFKVGAKKDGRIVALTHEIRINSGNIQGGAGHATIESARNQTQMYTANVPNWTSTFYTYKTNIPVQGASRSNTQQEMKWGWEIMMDEMAEVVGLDPIQFRLIHVSKPGTILFPAKDWNHNELSTKFEAEGNAVKYDAYASVEVLEEGAKAIGWEKRNPVAGGNPGRFKRGFGVAMSQHHAGHMGYHDGEVQFEKLTSAALFNSEMRNIVGLTAPIEPYTGELELGLDGYVTMKQGLPDSGTNHSTSMAALVAEILGFTTRDRIRVAWGDTDATPRTGGWGGGKTTVIQGGALCAAADKLRRGLLRRASDLLKVDAAKLQVKDGVITSAEDPRKRTTFIELVRLNKGPIVQQGQVIEKDHGRSLVKGVGACFAEVEVDTWTGDWKFVRSAYCHDAGLVINPLTAEADMHGSLIQSAQVATDAIPWDREFPGTRHYSVGYLSYRLPTIMDVPEQTNVFIDSLEPRWFFGYKSFAETTIGAPPAAIANAIYNACGVRIREHPITREKIMTGLKEIRARGGRA